MRPSTSLVLLLLGFAFLFSATARADSIFDVTGTLQLVGNNVCSGPCVETLKFSFDFQWVPPFPGIAFYLATVVPGTMSVKSSGPLGDFLGGSFNNGQGFIPFSNAGNDQLEFRVRHDVVHDFQTDPDATPIFLDADLYSCRTATCASDFVPPGILPGPGLFLPATLDYTVKRDNVPKEVPEPSTAMLLTCGALLLFVGIALRPGTSR